MGKGKDLYEENKRLKAQLAAAHERAQAQYQEDKKMFCAAALIGLLIAGQATSETLVEDAIAIGENFALKT